MFRHLLVLPWRVGHILILESARWWTRRKCVYLRWRGDHKTSYHAMFESVTREKKRRKVVAES